MGMIAMCWCFESAIKPKRTKQRGFVRAYCGEGYMSQVFFFQLLQELKILKMLLLSAY